MRLFNQTTPVRSLSVDRVRRFTPMQAAQRVTWAAVPDDELGAAHMSLIEQGTFGPTTVTHMNPLDPASAEDMGGKRTGERAWLRRPGGSGALYGTRPVWWML